MEDALLELESFQTHSSSSHGYPPSIEFFVDDNNDREIDVNSHFVFSSENNNKDSNRNHRGLELLLPRIETGLSIGTTTMMNSSLAVAISESNAPHIESDSRILPREGDLVIDDDDDDGVWRARWLLVAAAALYGTNFSVVKLLGDEMPVGISTSLRFGLAALATLPWLVQGFLPKLFLRTSHLENSWVQQHPNTAKSVDRPPIDSRVMATLYGLEVGLWNSIGYVAQAVGLETTLASESAFLCSMAVVIVPLLDWIAGKRLLNRQWVGALMALIGVAFLELGDFDSLLSSNGSGGGVAALSTGDVLSMVQPFTFGLGFWRMEQAMHRFPQEAPRMTAAQLMAIFVSSVGYCLFTFGAFDHFFDGSNSIGLALAGFQASLATIPSSYPWREWLSDPYILFSLFWTGCITTALTIYMETLALESLSAAETTLIFSTEPLWGTAFAVAVMGEQMGMNAVAGAGLILTACVYSNLGVHGLHEMWISTMSSVFARNKTSRHEPKSKKKKTSSSSPLLRSLQDQWPWLQSGLAGSVATWNIASDAGPQTQELDEIVEELIENLVDKL
jgi:drug/metabolite transporter (DMT)-like permease